MCCVNDLDGFAIESSTAEQETPSCVLRGQTQTSTVVVSIERCPFLSNISLTYKPEKTICKYLP
ncbi:hypothetical protein GJ744_009697 [Endocarpon pusillum]|uniref:Uncharacterized protein n=1 Tax=Endocarpon pusillum TaxID=364733 RepID=A0A8H7AUJ1_9EURO|nr:hypothetical protein GJ744_009697 [Endocarpon pusillum]